MRKEKLIDAAVDRPRDAIIRNSSNELASLTAPAPFDTVATAVLSLPTSRHEEAARWKRSISIASTGGNRPGAVIEFPPKRSFKPLVRRGVRGPVASTRLATDHAARSQDVAQSVTSTQGDFEAIVISSPICPALRRSSDTSRSAARRVAVSLTRTIETPAFIDTFASDFARRTSRSTSETIMQSSLFAHFPASTWSETASGHAARCIDPKCHHDQHSSAANGRNGASSRCNTDRAEASA